jgi:hypothetical protein
LKIEYLRNTVVLIYVVLFPRDGKENDRFLMARANLLLRFLWKSCCFERIVLTCENKSAHMFHDAPGKLRTFHFPGTFNLTGQVVGHRTGFNGGLQRLPN